MSLWEDGIMCGDKTPVALQEQQMNLILSIFRALSFVCWSFAVLLLSFSFFFFMPATQADSSVQFCLNIPNFRQSLGDAVLNCLSEIVLPPDHSTIWSKINLASAGNTEDFQEFRRQIFINGRGFCNVDLFAFQKGVAINFYCLITFKTMLLFPACDLLFQKIPKRQILISDWSMP